MIIEKFIQRPVLSIVISLFIVLLGLLALFSLPITQFPEIAPPSVIVTANYAGANAETCAKAVSTPLERAINGVPGMTYMTSVSSNNGTTVIQVFFKGGTDPDIAAVSVQNRVATVVNDLPEEVIKSGIVTEKEINSMLLYINLYSNDSTKNGDFIYNFCDINVLHELKRIEGVGYANIMGAREYSMRVWLNPERMLAYNISTDEVVEALRNQNVEAAPGRAGESSGKNPQSLQYVLKYTGKYNQKADYENIVLRSDEKGQLLKLKDIAEIEFGALNYSMISKTDGKASASIMLKQRPGSNAREVINAVKKRMEELKSTTFPPDLEYNYSYDVSKFLDASIHDVLKTLVEAFLLVLLVVFLFLQDFRSTLIPALAVPVSLIGTLAFILLFGFSINMLTLFALVLAIGIVVDDAIVVVEAVHVNMTQHHLSPKDATIKTMKDISGAIITITMVMSAVFIPVAFLSGPVGVFYRQFSITLAIAIILSGVVALTLTPTLCTLLLKRHEAKEKKPTMLDKFFLFFNKQYDASENRYRLVVGKIAGRRLFSVGILIAFFMATWGISSILPSGFIPTEDQSMIYVNLVTPPGSTLDRTNNAIDKLQSISKQLPEIDNITSLAGYSFISEAPGASYGFVMINLKPTDQRMRSINQIIEDLKAKSTTIKDASIEFFPPPTVAGFGNTSGFELRLIDKTGKGNIPATAEVTNQFIDSLRTSPIIASAFTNFDASFPQYLLRIDTQMAAQKGVTVRNAMDNLQVLVGSYYTSNFIRFGQMYRVMLQASPEFRSNPEDILKLYTKNNKGEMVPYSSFLKMERVYGPEQLTRYNMYTSALISGDAAEGFSSGQAIEEINRISKKCLPKGYETTFSGMTREQILAGNQTIFIFAICLIFVYLLLSAQYENFLLPLVIILSLPAGIFGSFFLLKIAGMENNIYAQVAMVMLIGLLGKNAILIVEFALQKQKEGHAIIIAAQLGAAARLRPILMTSIAFIAGLLPLCFANGAGALGNRSIGIASAGGMLFGTFVGLILVPGLYVIFASLSQKIYKNKKSTIQLKNS
jgi:hydrophobic/amphiphilic exporter-1 (mainly G- bacteria), HAE1 family